MSPATAESSTRSWWTTLLSEPRRPRRIREHPNAAWFVVGSVCIGAFMGQLDASIVTVALPRIAARLNSPIGTIDWVSLSYLLVLVCTLATVGRLADRLGRKLLYVYGFVVFTGSSLLCALAPSVGWLIAARVLQGLGAALLQANSVALIRETVADAQLGRAIGLQGTAQALGLALGPAVGGVLLSLGGWRLLFLVNVPAGVLGCVLGWLLLPRSRFRSDTGERFDLIGAALLAGAAGALLVLLSHIRSLGTAELFALALSSAASWIAFVARELGTRSPLVEVRLLADRRIGLGLAGALASFMVMFGALFAIPFFLSAHGLSPAVAGLELAVLPVALGVAAPIAGRLADRRPAPGLMASSIALTAAGLSLTALWHAPAGIIAGLAIAGLGLGGFIPANNATIMAAAARRQAGVMSGVLNMARGLGTALGIAVASVIYDGITSGGGSGAPGRGLTATLLALAGVALAAGVALWSATRTAR